MQYQHLSIKPCVGCGYCCKVAMCAIGVAKLGYIASICPYLEWNGHCYRCQLITKGINVGQGLGCCSPLNTERKLIK